MMNSNEKSGRDSYDTHRKDFNYVKRINYLLGKAAESDFKSIIDVGSREVDVISQLPLSRKVSIDLTASLIAEGVESIKGDFLIIIILRNYSILFAVSKHSSTFRRSSDSLRKYLSYLRVRTKKLFIKV